MSLEKQVNENTPPVFLWQTATDETVPVENSYLMAMELKNAGIPFEHHVFPNGIHGLSLANEDWAEGRFGEPYFFIHPESAGTLPFPANSPVKEVAVWPDLADIWMRENCF